MKTQRSDQQMIPEPPQLAFLAGDATTAATRRHLDPALFDRAVWRLAGGGLDIELAVRAVEEAWAFLELGSRLPTRGRLGLKASNRVVAGLLGTAGLFELGGGHVAEVAVEATNVMPVNAAPGPPVGPLVEFGLVEAELNERRDVTTDLTPVAASGGTRPAGFPPGSPDRACRRDDQLPQPQPRPRTNENENSMSPLKTRPDHESTRTEHHVKTLPRPDQTIPPHPQLAAAGIETAAATRRQLHPALFDRAVWRLVSVGGLDGGLAVRAVEEAWAFLELCSRLPTWDTPLTPTPLVDRAWHATILFTRGYLELCAALGARGLIHHEPHDDPGSHGGGGAEGTVRAFHATGIQFDQELWATGSPVSNCARPEDEQCSCN